MLRYFPITPLSSALSSINTLSASKNLTPWCLDANLLSSSLMATMLGHRSMCRRLLLISPSAMSFSFFFRAMSSWCFPTCSSSPASFLWIGRIELITTTSSGCLFCISSTTRRMPSRTISSEQPLTVRSLIPIPTHQTLGSRPSGISPFMSRHRSCGDCKGLDECRLFTCTV